MNFLIPIAHEIPLCYPATSLCNILKCSFTTKKNQHAVLMNNIRRCGMEVHKNVSGDVSCLYAAVCERFHQRKRHISLRKEVVNFLENNPHTVSVIML